MAAARPQAVSYVDWNIGKVLTELETLEYGPNTVVVLNADHGESVNY